MLAFALVTTGPLTVYLLLRWLGDPLAGSTARWTLVLVLAVVPAFLVVRGLALLVPTLAGRYLALRRSQRKAYDGTFKVEKGEAGTVW